MRFGKEYSLAFSSFIHLHIFTSPINIDYGGSYRRLSELSRKLEGGNKLLFRAMRILIFLSEKEITFVVRPEDRVAVLTICFISISLLFSLAFKSCKKIAFD